MRDSGRKPSQDRMELMKPERGKKSCHDFNIKHRRVEVKITVALSTKLNDRIEKKIKNNKIMYIAQGAKQKYGKI